MNNIVYYVCAVYGLLIGSFLNVLIYRLPKRESIIIGRSHCPRCDKTLKFYELIPVLSYLGLRGKCHKCGCKISIIYPVVEILTATLYYVTVRQLTNEVDINYKVALSIAITLAIVSILIALSFIDIATFILPDKLVLTILPLAVAQSVLNSGTERLQHSIEGGLLFGGIFYLIHIIKPNGLGLGDVKLITAIGVLLGVINTMMVIFIASLLGTLYGVLSILSGTNNRKSIIPFGPFLSVATFIILLWSSDILNLILR